jgi:hypothetical protein
VHDDDFFYDPELDDPFLPRDPETGDPDPTSECDAPEWPGLGNLWREWRELRKQRRA